MSTDPRAALSALVAALEQHLELAAVRRGEDDPAVVTAYDRIADAFDAYDEALMQAYGEVTPLQVFDDEDEDDDPEDDDVDDGDFDEPDEDAVDSSGSYVGLDDADYDDSDDDRTGRA